MGLLRQTQSQRGWFTASQFRVILTCDCPFSFFANEDLFCLRHARFRANDRHFEISIFNAKQDFIFFKYTALNKIRRDKDNLATDFRNKVNFNLWTGFTLCSDRELDVFGFCVIRNHSQRIKRSFLFFGFFICTNIGRRRHYKTDDNQNRHRYHK